MPFFNFGELVPNGKVTVFEGHLVAVEIAMIGTGKNRNAAGAVLRNLKEEQFSSSKYVEKRMRGTGNGRTKLLTFSDAIELLMVLPGENAKDFRLKCVELIKRFLAGDVSLIQDIEANAQSDAPIHQMARDTCASDMEVENEAIVGQKRLHDSVVMSRELVTNFKAANEHMREQNILVRERGEIDIDFLRKRHEYEQAMLRARHDLEQTNRMSELDHAKAMLDIERAKAALSQPQQVQQAPQGNPVPAGHTTILKVYHKNKAAFDMLKASQIRGLLQSAGIKAKAAFEALHGTTPMRFKEGQFDVLCYPEDDEPLILEAIRSAMRDLLGHARPITSFVSFNSTTT
jgi:hypothetical protein